MAPTRQGTERGFDRLIFFSDAVVAIAITLLILPVVDSVSADESTSNLFDHGGPRIGAFLLSFAVIAWFWILHHSLFERVAGYNAPLVWASGTAIEPIGMWALALLLLTTPFERWFRRRRGG